MLNNYTNCLKSFLRWNYEITLIFSDSVNTLNLIIYFIYTKEILNLLSVWDRTLNSPLKQFTSYKLWDVENSIYINVWDKPYKID